MSAPKDLYARRLKADYKIGTPITPSMVTETFEDLDELFFEVLEDEEDGPASTQL